MRVEVKKSANKSLKKISKNTKIKILNKLIQIEIYQVFVEVPNDGKLKGYKDRYKIRVGNYRVVLKKISDTHVDITAIAGRKEIYKKLFGITLSL